MQNVQVNSKTEFWSENMTLRKYQKNGHYGKEMPAFVSEVEISLDSALDYGRECSGAWDFFCQELWKSPRTLLSECTLNIKIIAESCFSLKLAQDCASDQLDQNENILHHLQ